MAVLVTAIHAFPCACKTWMPGTEAGHDEREWIEGRETTGHRHTSILPFPVMLAVPPEPPYSLEATIGCGGRSLRRTAGHLGGGDAFMTNPSFRLRLVATTVAAAFAWAGAAQAQSAKHYTFGYDQ